MSVSGEQGFRQSQAFLHTWSGLLLGWLLFAVFVTGTIAFYREGLNRWMRPELPPVTQPERVVAGAQRYLAQRAPDAKSWFITLPGASSHGAVVSWLPQLKEGERPRRRRGEQMTIDANGDPVDVRATRGGEFFYRFHFDLYYMPVIWARWLVGIAALFMLVAILSGVVTHKKIFRDFFTLRRGKGQRSWLDAHNATAVLGLPFHLMITYTGLVTLMVTLLPWATVAAYSDKGKAYYDSLYPEGVQAERTGRAAPLVDLTAVLRDAEPRLGGAAGYIEVNEPGDAGAKVSVLRSGATMLSSRTPRMTYDGVTGKPVWTAPPQDAASTTAGAMIGVHAGRFANDWLRFVYFLSGVAGCLMVASGMVMWTVKRREKLPDPDRPHFGFRVVERLNVAAIGGLPLGIAALFWANRLLPVGMAGRAEWEIHCLFIAWGAASLLALTSRARVGWVVLFTLTGALLVALPLYNLVGTDAGLFAALGRGDGMLAGIDGALLVFGLGFFAVARRVGRYRSAKPKRRRSLVPAMTLEPAQ